MLSNQSYFVVEECCKMVLSTIAFYIRIYLRNLAFQETFVFSFYLLVVEVYELHQFVISVGLYCLFL